MSNGTLWKRQNFRLGLARTGDIDMRSHINVDAPIIDEFHQFIYVTH
jgi:hypothetical protein